MEQVPLIAEIRERVVQRNPPEKAAGELLRKAVVHELIDFQVSDLLGQSGPALLASGFHNAEQARQAQVVICPSAGMQHRKIQLEQFLYQKVYRHPRLLAVRQQAQQRLQEMFQRLVRHPEGLPAAFRQRAESRGLPRTVGEYLAGMTDRYCDQQFRDWFRDDGRGWLTGGGAV
jgi:dGTPase